MKRVFKPKAIVLVALLIVVVMITNNIPVIASGGVSVEDASCASLLMCNGSATCNSGGMKYSCSVLCDDGSSIYCNL